MRLTVNGDTLDLPALSSVHALLEHLELAGKPVVVELNQRALFPREMEDAPLQDGDVIELVQITAGG